MSETFICSHCGATADIDECNIFNNVELCDECYEDETVICSRCGERIWADNAADSDLVLCQECYDDYYTTCESCGRTVHVDDACYFDDSEYPYCPSCYERRNKGEYIHDYNYKPSPVFYGSGERYFGVELEIDHGGHSDENACTIAETANSDNRLI